MAVNIFVTSESSQVNELLNQIKQDLSGSSGSRKLMSDIGLKLENEMKRQITQMEAVDTGVMRGAISTLVPDPWSSRVTAHKFYSPYVARGTGKKGLESASEYGWPTSWYNTKFTGMAARPFDLAAIDAKEDEIIYMLTQFTRKVARGRA